MAQQHHHRAHIAAHRRAAFEHDAMFKRAPAAEPELATVYSVVYVTATPTFSGPIAGYTTLNPPSSTSKIAPTTVGLVGIPLQNSRSAASSSSVVIASSAGPVAKGTPLQNSRSAEASSSPSLEVVSTSSASSSSQQPTTFLTSSTAAFTSSTSLSSTSTTDTTSILIQDAVTASSSSAAPLLASSSTTTTAKSQEQPTGMTAGAKAGLTIGIVLALGIIVGLAFFFLRLKRKHNTRDAADDEKSSFRGPQQLVRARTSIRNSRFSVPRLSLRPVSHQMFPAGTNEKQDSERPQSQRIAPIQHTLGSNPFHDANIFIPPAISVADIPKPLSIKSRDRNGSMPESFVSSGASTNSPSAGAGPNDVHRIHADFTPSMDDELELRAGALVRMLHEYDDGWALCIRLDRSQQGVVPRSCLSKMPVKPRIAQNQPRVPQPAFMLQTGGGRLRAQSAAAASSISLASSRTAPVELEGSPTLDSSPTLPSLGAGVGRKPVAGQGC